MEGMGGAHKRWEDRRGGRDGGGWEVLIRKGRWKGREGWRGWEVS